MNHLNLEVIKKAYENDRETLSFGKYLRFDQVKWLIDKVEQYENASNVNEVAEKKVRDQYQAIRNRYPNFTKFDEGVLAGMSDTLYLLRIKIKGVNEY